MGDRITDLLAVIAEIQREHRKGTAARARELRIGAVEAVAQRGRFKNLQSARNTINDALARRFGGRSLPEFDALVGDHLRSKSSRLVTAALNACWNDTQRAAVRSMLDQR
jgi:hypothetical protein